MFTANDQMALGVVHAASERGLAVPDDLSVVGFDDIPEAAHFGPPLATMQQLAEVGRRAIAHILAEIQPGGVPVAVTAEEPPSRRPLSSGPPRRRRPDVGGASSMEPQSRVSGLN